MPFALLALPSTGGVVALLWVGGHSRSGGADELGWHGPYALVDELFVEDIWRGQKIGTQTLAFAEEWTRGRGFRALRLEVGHSNPGALRLYRRYGFDAPDRHLLSKAL